MPSDALHARPRPDPWRPRPDVGTESYGLVLRDEDGVADVVSGERFVSAITRVGHRPTVVTIASCDSGNVGSVVIPGASFAHALHQAGVPLVVASQFPLSMEGSVPLAARLYEGLLWGEHPLRVLQQARAELHARYNTNWHDWASLVVYEALPPALDEQLDALRYSQAKRAIERRAGADRSRRRVARPRRHDESARRARQRAVTMRGRAAAARRPVHGECIGLRASSRKRLAQAAFDLASDRRPAPAAVRRTSTTCSTTPGSTTPRRVRGLLVNDARAAAAHGDAALGARAGRSLSAVLGSAIEEGEWEAAKLCRRPLPASIPTRSSAPGRTQAWRSCGCSGWPTPSSPAPSERRCAAEALRAREELERLLSRASTSSRSSRRGGSSSATSTGGAAERFDEALQGRDATRRAYGRATTASSAIGDAARGTAAAAAADPTPLRRAPAPPAPPADAGGRRRVRGEAGTQPSGGADSARPLNVAQAPTPPRAGDGAVLRHRSAAGRTRRLPVDRVRRRRQHASLADRLRHAGHAPALLRRVDALPADRAVPRAVRAVAHRLGSHRRRAAVLQGRQATGCGSATSGSTAGGTSPASSARGRARCSRRAIQDFELPWNAGATAGPIVVGDGDLPEHVAARRHEAHAALADGARSSRSSPPSGRSELKRYGLEPGGRVDYSRFLKGTPSTIADVDALADIDALADTPFGGDAARRTARASRCSPSSAAPASLLAADAHAPVLVESITTLLEDADVPRLKLDLFKVSHHASQNNVSTELLQLLDCPRYLVSTNGDHFCHPDRQAIGPHHQVRRRAHGGVFQLQPRYNEVWGSPALEGVRRSGTARPTTRRPEARASRHAALIGAVVGEVRHQRKVVGGAHRVGMPHDVAPRDPIRKRLGHEDVVDADVRIRSRQRQPRIVRRASSGSCPRSPHPAPSAPCASGCARRSPRRTAAGAAAGCRRRAFHPARRC